VFPTIGDSVSPVKLLTVVIPGKSENWVPLPPICPAIGNLGNFSFRVSMNESGVDRGVDKGLDIDVLLLGWVDGIADISGTACITCCDIVDERTGAVIP